MPPAGRLEGAQEALLQAEANYRDLVERLPLIVYIDDATLSNIYTSPQTTAILGYTPEDWAANQDLFPSMLHPDDRERVLTEHHHTYATGEPLRTEYRVSASDGCEVWIRDEAVLIQDEDGNAVCLQGYMLDITERKERESAVRESEARTRAMLDAGLDCIVTIDHEGLILEFNPAAERAFGYERADVIGEPMSELLIPLAMREAYSAGFRRFLATGEGPVLGQRIELPAMRADGTEFPAELSIVRVDVPGDPLFTAYIRDITERNKRERALLESAAIVGSSFDAVAGRTLEGLVTSWNAAAERTFGYSADEIIGRSIGILAPPERTDELDVINDRLRRGDSVERFETVRMRKDGTRIEVESTISPITDATGRLVGVSSISRDITARKRSEALAAGQVRLLELIAVGTPLAEVLDRLAHLVEELSGDALVSILVLDRDGLHLRHGAAPSLPAAFIEAIDGLALSPNAGSCGPAAYRRETVVARDIATDPLWSESRALALDNGLRACASTPIFASDGTLLASFAMFYREPREPGERDLRLAEMATQIAGVAIERARSEETLRASESRYRDLFENASDMIATVDLDRNITAANSALAEALGYTTDELLHMNLAQVLPPEAQQLALYQLTQKLAEEIGVSTDEHDFVARDGQRVAVEVKTRVIWQDGKPAGVEAIARDVSRRKQLEEQLSHAQKMEAVGQLAGGVAHDFNNMMSGVIGFSELVLARLEEDHPARAQVAQIKRAGERASDMTSQLLAFSRKQVLRPRLLDVNASVTETESLLGRLIGEDIEVVSDLDPRLDTVYADPGQLEQVIVNLVVNARDAMPTGGKLTIKTRNVELDAADAATHIDLEPGAYVLLSVSDDGTGMDAQTQARIFEPFFTTKNEGSGTGLGLATVYGIIKQSGGDISVSSEPGRGTTLEIYLPSALTTGVEHEEPAAAAAETPRGSETVLLVEDEEIVRQLEREVLQENGYTVLEAQDTEHAIRLCGEHPGTIHLLLTDVVMPQMSGRELAEQLAPIRPEMKVLYASGYAEGVITHHGVLEPGTAFLPKPLTPASLTRMVRTVLDTP
jgi:two-component system, cell cycle sensor histidine kinase and response regulator CckA